jgi:hypothetical protein
VTPPEPVLPLVPPAVCEPLETLPSGVSSGVPEHASAKLVTEPTTHARVDGVMLRSGYDLCCAEVEGTRSLWWVDVRCWAHGSARVRSLRNMPLSAVKFTSTPGSGE